MMEPEQSDEETMEQSADDKKEDDKDDDKVIVDQFFCFEQSDDVRTSTESDCASSIEDIHPELREAMQNFCQERKQFFYSMQDAYNDSFCSLEADNERQLRETIDKTYFEQTFLPSLGLHFERLCYLLVNCISAPCGLCSLRIRKSHIGEESNEDTMMDRWQSVACPHLVAEEWSAFLKLRLVGRQFWRAFLASEIGRQLVLYVVLCGSCDYSNMMVGSSSKQHPSNVISALARRKRVAEVCGFGDERMVETKCYCRKNVWSNRMSKGRKKAEKREKDQTAPTGNVPFANSKGQKNK